MIVLAESNLVLELALQQEQSSEVESIVALAEAKQIELVIPACAFTEPYQTLIRRLRERKQLIENIQRSFKQVGRADSRSWLPHPMKSRRPLPGQMGRKDRAWRRQSGDSSRAVVFRSWTPPSSRTDTTSNQGSSSTLMTPSCLRPLMPPFASAPRARSFSSTRTPGISWTRRSKSTSINMAAS